MIWPKIIRSDISTPKHSVDSWRIEKGSIMRKHTCSFLPRATTFRVISWPNSTVGFNSGLNPPYHLLDIKN